MLIKNWEELSKIPNESDTHILTVDVERGIGQLRSKHPKTYDEKLTFMDQIKYLDVYLSTHTFYGSQYERSTEILKACGFDVEIDNWDRYLE